MNGRRDNIDLIVSTAELASVFDKKSSLSNLLQDIVEMVAEHMSADVCSIYLYDKKSEELVLRATVGLSPTSIGAVRLKMGEGITGTALQELRPIREASASKNPNFKFFQDIYEEQFEAFLAVPIRKGLNRIGVITIQHREPNYFSRRDTAALKAIASQLAASIENSEWLMSLSAAKKDLSSEFYNLSIRGTGASAGTVRGEAFLLNVRRAQSNVSYQSLVPGDELQSCRDSEDDTCCTDVNLTAFDRALELSMNQLEELQSSIDESLADVAGMIFTAHFLMLRDDNFTGQMRQLIEAGFKADESVRRIVSQYSDIFEKSDLPGIQEKVQDLRDLEHRLLANLYGESLDHADYSHNIVIAEDIFPSELVKIWLQRSQGLVLYGTGITAHISILARSLGFPMLITGDRRVLSIPGGSELFMDTRMGLLHVNPSRDIVESYATRLGKKAFEDFSAIPEQTFTADGERIMVFANINITHDIKTAVNVKAEGVGLYRSEFPFIIRNEFPSEEEQCRIYRKILQRAEGRECILRTLDIGGDKIPGYASNTSEANPFLGFRGIRFSLGHPELFQDQIRAMLRAGDGFKLKIMFPMVSSVDEFLEAKELVEKCIDFLKNDGAPANLSPELGAMVELPAAVEAIDDLAEAADFLSIGTNDLIMYTLAVDRTNEMVRGMFKPCHPAILRSLKRITEGALAAGTELSVCGEAAGEPGILKYLIGLGIRKVSVDPLRIPELKNMISGWTLDDCNAFMSQALYAKTVKEAEALFK